MTLTERQSYTKHKKKKVSHYGIEVITLTERQSYTKDKNKKYLIVEL
jgi:hypothetical protein